MLKFLFIISFSLLTAGCARIGFSYNVRCADSDVFIDECKFGKVDSEHFVYKNVRPSVVFIYSDAVEHCRQQAKVFDSVAARYSGGVMFWAIEYDDAQSLLECFPSDGRLPIYLYINQNCAQKIVPEHITAAIMQKHIAEAFGIFPIDDR